MMSAPTHFNDIGNGCAVVLLHGFPFNRSMWREQIEFLSAHGYRCIAPDLRGLGENVAQTSVCEPTAEEHRLKSVPLTTMDDMARDVATLLDELKIDQAIICGLSMGCYVAFEFAHLFRSRLSALVLAGGRCEGPDKAEKQSREQQAKRVLEQGFAPSVESILQSLLAPQTLADKPEIVARVREMVAKTDPRGAAAAQRGMAARRDYCGDLPKISVPTLIIAGRDDGVRKPIDAETIHRGIKGSRLETIKGAGHLMNMEQPEVFNQVIWQFLEQLNQ
jgi:pimeloyl-ACP methyl ester carboxylesterase